MTIDVRREKQGYQLPLTPEPFLQDLAADKVKDARLSLGAWSNELVYPLFVEACFVDPIYGGNLGKVFWKCVKMWGTSSLEDKLAGDLGNVIEAISTGGRSVGFFYSRKISAEQFGTFATISARRRHQIFSAPAPIQTNWTRIPHIPSMITVAMTPATTAPPTMNRSANVLLTPCAIMTERVPVARCARTKNAPSQ